MSYGKRPFGVDTFGGLDIRDLALGSIASAAAFGTVKLNGMVSVSGIAAAEVFGAPRLNGSIIVGQISSTEAFGTPLIVGYIHVGGIASAEAFGIIERLVNWGAIPRGGAILVEFEDRTVLVVMDRNPGVVTEPERVVRVAAESRRVVVPAD